jgi:hypothetical protein
VLVALPTAGAGGCRKDRGVHLFSSLIYSQLRLPMCSYELQPLLSDEMSSSFGQSYNEPVAQFGPVSLNLSFSFPTAIRIIL